MEAGGFRRSPGEGMGAMNDRELRDRLEALSEPGYQKFASALIPSVPQEKILGVRLPKLRALARELAADDWRAYLRCARCDTFEEVMLQGLVISGLEEEPGTVLSYAGSFIPKIDNWSVCDAFCAGFRLARTHPDAVWGFIQPYLRDDREYGVRFGAVMLLSYFADRRHASEAFRLLDEAHCEGYYARMAVAWAVSALFAALPERTFRYLGRSSLDDFTYRKALQKILESRQTGAEYRERIKTMRSHVSEP